MQDFLEQIADYILENHAGQAHRLQVVFPNRRAGLFLQKKLSEKRRQTLWMPHILSMEQFLEQFSELKVADSLLLNFRLFPIFEKLMPGAQNFDQFFPWGEIILRDFNSLDSQCVDVPKLLVNIKDLQEIDQDAYFTDEQKVLIKEFWKVFEKDSDGRQNFLKFWNILPALYEQFRSQIESEGMAYRGMIARQAAEDENLADKLSGKEVLFCGFNALTRAEELVMKKLLQARKAQIFWDVDQHMLSDEQEAGYFMRRWLRDEVFKATFPQEIPSLLRQKTADSVSLTELPLQHAQGSEACRQLAASLADKLPSDAELTRTAMVLPDETQLFPLLQQLPAQLEDRAVNVTMGVSLRTTPVYSLLEKLISLQQSRSGDYFHHQPVISLLRHPYVRSADLRQIGSLLFDIESKNRVYIGQQQLSINELAGLIFSPAGEGLDLGRYLLKVLDFINLSYRSRKQAKGQVLLEEEYLGRARTQLERLISTAEAYDAQMSSDLLARLIRQMLQQLKIPFVGEPLQGLQIMGMLETRSLDFDEVYILSLNEGILPGAQDEPSLIPYFLRSAYGLPTVDMQDAIFAYHFYRLLMRSKKVHLFYSSYQADGKEAEASRFVQQIRHERWPELEVKKVNLAARTTAPQVVSIKREEVQQKLQAYLSNGQAAEKTLSPSALNTYLHCRLQFAFRYLLEIREPDEVAEEVDAAFFGKIMHDVLQQFYEPALKKGVNAQWIDDQLQQVPLKERILKVYREKSGEVPQLGRNSIYLDIIEKMIAQVLEVDKEYAPFSIVSLEEEYSYDFPLDGGKRITIKGKIDRIDEKEGNIRIIDYKTGKDGRTFPDWISLFDRESNKRNKAAMQVLLYSLLYANAQNGQLNDKQLQPALYNSRELYQQDFNALLQKDKLTFRSFDEPSQDDFREQMKNMLLEIFTYESIHFDQRKADDGCKYCGYKEICGR
ncbi:MAG: PD-(D/E)XK nuclease family protein [Cyclobacteriaceae bacterium]